MAAEANDNIWYKMFAVGLDDLKSQQRFLRRLPSPPRCKLCNAPFAGIGGAWMRFRGRHPSSRNPRYCRLCDQFIRKNPGGTEVELSMVFADVRGSTTVAGTMSPAEFSRLVNKFYQATTAVLIDSDGFIQDLVGDEVVALYPPGFSGPQHASKAVQAARELMAIPSSGTSARSSGLPFGIGVHTGKVYIGTVIGAAGEISDVRASGFNVNLTSRLASAAGPGEVFVSAAAWQAAGMDMQDCERRKIEAKGAPELIDVVVMRSAAA